MNWLTIVPKRLLLELAGIGLFGAALWVLNLDRQNWKQTYELEHTRLLADSTAYDNRLRAALAAKAADLAAVDRGARDLRAIGPIVLRPHLAVCPASGPSGGDPGGSGRDLPALRQGADPMGSGSGRDIGPLFAILLERAETCNADLAVRQKAAIKLP